MKKFPINELKIGGHVWKVKLTPFTSALYKRKISGSRCRNNKQKEVFYYGLTTWQDRTIRINNTLPHSMKVETLIHEIMHVMFDEVKSIKVTTSVEESLVQGLAFLFHTVFVDNPKLTKYISTKEVEKKAARKKT